MGLVFGKTGGEWALTFTLTLTFTFTLALTLTLTFSLPRASSSSCNSQFYFHFITRNKDKLHKICAPRCCTNQQFHCICRSANVSICASVSILWIHSLTHLLTWPTPWAASAFLCKLCRRQAKTSGKYPLTKSRKSQKRRWSQSWVHRAWNC